jgi:tetratricopeptide (TPR) repeat protein
MSEAHRYKAFISYSHDDERVARWLHRALETYQIPRRLREIHGIPAERLAPIFRDRDEFASSSDLSTAIREALMASEALIVICSPAAARSRWVNAEVAAFLGACAAPVLCLMTGGQPGSAATCFPPALRGKEPLAADLAVDGRRTAKLKLVAGLLGVGLDELIQRDAHRRQRRLTLVTAGSVVGMLLAVGLSFYAFNAERRAAAAQVRAEHEARLSGELTEFLLSMFETTHPADRRGAEITARELLARGARRADTTLSASDANVRIHHALGRAYLELQLLPEAQAHLQQARLGAEEGSDVALEISIDKGLAQLEMYRGEFAEADAHLTELVSRAEAMLGPQHPETLTLTGNLATAKLYQGEVGEAERLLGAAHAGLNATLGADHQTTLRTQSALAMAHAHGGRVDDAIAVMDDVVQRQRTSLGEDHPQTIDSLDNLATFYMRKGDWARAAELAEQGMALNLRVHGKRSPQTATIHANLSFVRLQMEDFAAAESHARSALRLLRQYFGNNHEHTLAAAENLAEALYAQGATEESKSVLRYEINRLTIELGSEDPRLVRAVLVHAELPFRAGDTTEAGTRLDLLEWTGPAFEVWQSTRPRYDDSFVSFVDAWLAAERRMR